MIVRRVATADPQRLAETPTCSWREAYRGLLPDWRLGSLSADRFCHSGSIVDGRNGPSGRTRAISARV